GISLLVPNARQPDHRIDHDQRRLAFMHHLREGQDAGLRRRVSVHEDWFRPRGPESPKIGLYCLLTFFKGKVDAFALLRWLVEEGFTVGHRKGQIASNG